MGAAERLQSEDQRWRTRRSTALRSSSRNGALRSSRVSHDRHAAHTGADRVDYGIGRARTDFVIIEAPSKKLSLDGEMSRCASGWPHL
jgi:hypothetical protein